MQSCLRHCKAGSFSEYSKVIIEHIGRVRICKMIFTYHRRENDISQMQSADNFLDSATCHYGRGHYSNRFPTTSHIAYREAVSLTRLVKEEIVSPYYEILINADLVIQPCYSHISSGIGED